MKKKLEFDSIMLVDDNPDDNFFHQIILEEVAPTKEIIVMGSAIDALSYLEKSREEGSTLSKPDLIFLDINMPRMNGLEFLEKYNEVKEAKGYSSIIMMLTTTTDEQEIERAEKLGIEDFLTKPLNNDKVRALIGW